MTFSKRKLTEIRNQRGRGFSTFLIALLIASACFVPYIISGEGYFLFYGDFNTKQIPFYQMCHAAVRNGEINWNWLTDLGAGFIGSYTFYTLGSPFFWITLLFPNGFVPYLMGPLLILKFALSALTGYLYINRFTRSSDTARLGGLLYAFSGFSVYNIFFNNFHEAIIIFPLLLLSLELLITENRRGLLAVSVMFAALSNYVLFFGMVIFTVIYFFVRVFSSAVKVKISRFFVLCFETVLGVLMASVVLYPSVLALISDPRLHDVLVGWDAVMYGKEQIYLNIIECFFFPPDLPANPVFFSGADVECSSLGGWLPLFSMTGFITLFIYKKGNWLKRILAVSAFMAMVPILNSAFYAFNTAYYARWFYMPVLMICLATATVLEDDSAPVKSGYGWTVVITAVITLVIGLFPQRDSGGNLIFGLYKQSEGNGYITRFWLTSLIAMVSLAVLGLVLKLLRRNRGLFMKVATVFVAVVSIVYSSVFVGMGRTYSYDVKDVMIDKLIEGEVLIDEDEEYRIDVYDGVDNTGMYLGLPSINAFHSAVPESITEFYEYIGEERSGASRPSVENYQIRAFLSAKYLLNPTDGDAFDTDGETVMPGYEYVRTTGGYYLYENLNNIPYGFSYDYYMTEDVAEYYSENRADLLVKAMLLTPEQEKKYAGYMENIRDVRNDDQADVKLEFSYDEFEKDCKRLSYTSATSFKTDKNGFTAEVIRDKKSLVFFSVPYDEGWSATVNGKRAEIEKVNAGFMAVAVEKGESKIVFTYKTPGLAAGIKTSLIAVAVFAVYLLVSFIVKKRSPSEDIYPEGDELLARWRKDDLNDIILEKEEEDMSHSLLDDLPDIEIPKINNGFSGGFVINIDQDDD